MIAGPSAPAGATSGDEGLLTYASRAMGSPLRLTIVAPIRDEAAARRAAAAWSSVVHEFESSEQAMSRFRETSEITALNRRAGSADWTAVTRRLSSALLACDRAYRLTRGRFDPRVLSDLERLGDRGAPIGGGRPVAIHRARDGDRVGRRIVERSAAGKVRLPAPVDLGGIGKGLALRWAAAGLRRAGWRRFLLEAGGDLVAMGEPSEGGPWRVGIEDPTGGASPLAVVAASDGAVVTSSVRRRRWVTRDRPVHHLIDPDTGEPGGAGLLAVTVAGADPAWAEVWSKTLFLEARAGVAALARRRDLAAWWVVDEGSLEMTASARVRTLWAPSGAG